MTDRSSSRQSAIVVAAGSGVRAGFTQPKQFVALGGKALLRWSVEAFARAGVRPIIVVIDLAWQSEAEVALAGIEGVVFVAGGANRTASVRSGMAALAAGKSDIVHIHDAARPGLSPTIIKALADQIASGVDAAAPALSVADALKVVRGDQVEPGPTRENLRRVQTPQSFVFAAYAAALGNVDPSRAFDDDIDIAAAAGLTVRLISGAPELMKLTFAEDLQMLERMLAPVAQPRIGSGFDAHRFGPGDHVTLCGVKIAHNQSVLGHSDADAAWHALTDALLGAIAAGDIGDHFPPTDPQWKGAPSRIFLAHARDLIVNRGGRIGNVDLTIICERPKIKPHRAAMQAATAELLGLPLDRVSVKATTTEEMGFTGREEGLAAQAAAIVFLPEADHV